MNIYAMTRLAFYTAVNIFWLENDCDADKNINLVSNILYKCEAIHMSWLVYQ